MDAMLARQDLQAYVKDGAQDFERLAVRWGVLDVDQLKSLARAFAERIGFEGEHGEMAAELAGLIYDNR